MVVQLWDVHTKVALSCVEACTVYNLRFQFIYLVTSIYDFRFTHGHRLYIRKLYSKIPCTHSPTTLLNYHVSAEKRAKKGNF